MEGLTQFLSSSAGIFYSLIGVLLLMFFFLWLGWLSSLQKKVVKSPYTANPMRRFDTLSYISVNKVEAFLNYSGYDNRMFNIHRAAVCRDTGRIFPDTINWRGKMELDWSFLQKRHPGHYVSWGSLSYEQKQIIENAHNTLEGYQTEYSSSFPIPSQIEPEYAYAKPGPLYVDIDTRELLGWKCVPDSELEVLILQQPKDPTGMPNYLREEKILEENKKADKAKKTEIG